MNGSIRPKVTDFPNKRETLTFGLLNKIWLFKSKIKRTDLHKILNKKKTNI